MKACASGLDSAIENSSPLCGEQSGEASSQLSPVVEFPQSALAVVVLMQANNIQVSLFCSSQPHASSQTTTECNVYCLCFLWVCMYKNLSNQQGRRRVLYCTRIQMLEREETGLFDSDITSPLQLLLLFPLHIVLLSIILYNKVALLFARQTMHLGHNMQRHAVSIMLLPVCLLLPAAVMR